MTFVGEQVGAAVWSNFPISDVHRLGNLTEAQRQAAFAILATTLSRQGYQPSTAPLRRDIGLLLPMP